MHVTVAYIFLHIKQNNSTEQTIYNLQSLYQYTVYKCINSFHYVKPRSCKQTIRNYVSLTSLFIIIIIINLFISRYFCNRIQLWTRLWFSLDVNHFPLRYHYGHVLLTKNGLIIFCAVHVQFYHLYTLLNMKCFAWTLCKYYLSLE